VEYIGSDKVKEQDAEQNGQAKDQEGSGNYVTLDTGSVIANRYVVESALGSGNMGSVYKVTDREIAQTQVAIKVLHSKFSSKKNLKRFMKEARIMHQITHQNVVRTYAFGTDGDLVFYTMEYLKGKSLDALIDEGSLDVERIPTLALQICKGLESIHNAQVVHRDLKPANIMVTDEGVTKIMDFGIARSDDSNMTAHGEILGSAGYMAPEIWLGEKHTEAIDIYAIGVILYELSTGELPFKAKAAAALMRHHLDTVPIPPKEKNPDVPVWLNDLVVNLLEKDPMQRPRCVRDVINALERGKNGPAEGESVTSTMVSGGSQGGAWKIAGGILGGIAATVIVTQLFGGFSGEGSQAPQEHVAPSKDSFKVARSSETNSFQESLSKGANSKLAPSSPSAVFKAEKVKQAKPSKVKEPKASDSTASSNALVQTTELEPAVKPVIDVAVVVPDPVDIPSLVSGLSSSDISKVREAEVSLAGLPNQAEKEIINIFPSMSSEGRLRAIKILGDFDSTASANFLAESLGSEDAREAQFVSKTMMAMTAPQAKVAVDKFVSEQQAKAVETARLAKEAKEAEEAKVAKAAKAEQDAKAAREAQEAKAAKAARVAKEAKEARSPREIEEAREAEEVRAARKAREAEEAERIAEEKRFRKKAEEERKARLAKEKRNAKKLERKKQEAVKAAAAKAAESTPTSLTRVERRRLAKEALAAGNKQFWSKNYDAASAQYRRAVSLDSSFTQAHTALGKSLQAQGKKAEAESVIRGAIDKNKSSSEKLKLIRLLDKINKGSR